MRFTAAVLSPSATASASRRRSRGASHRVDSPRNGNPLSTNGTRRAPIGTRAHEIVNYFGKCPRCGYPALASAYVTTFSDGSTEASVIAACESPCGWRGPVAPTTMTGEPPVFRENRRTP